MYFYPENFRVTEIALEWLKRGYKVSVLTGYPNYPEGKLFPGYKQKITNTESYKGITIHRVPIFLRGNKIHTLILNYISFILTGILWALFTKEKPDKIFIFALSPIFQGIPPILLAKLRRVPCFIYVQDLWPESAEAVFKIKSPFIIKPIEWIARYIYKSCHFTFVTSPGYSPFISRLGVNQEKIIYWPQHAEFITSQPPESATGESVSIIYAGNIGEAQGLDTLVSSIKLLKDEAISSKSIKVTFLGNGRFKNDLQKIINDYKIEEYFEFLPSIPSQDVPLFISNYSISYLSLQDSLIFNLTIPAKLQTYLGAGVPILACANGEVPRILDESKAGLWAKSGDAQELALQIKKFIKLSSNERKLMGLRGSEYCKKHFEKKLLFDQMDTFLKN